MSGQGDPDAWHRWSELIKTVYIRQRHRSRFWGDPCPVDWRKAGSEHRVLTDANCAIN